MTVGGEQFGLFSGDGKETDSSGNPVEELVGGEPEEAEPEAAPPMRAELESDGQIPLLEIGTWWEEHWRSMPEFVQKDLEPFASVLVHFESRSAMERFARLVDQTINLTTRSIWYPKAEIGRFADKSYE